MLKRDFNAARKGVHPLAMLTDVFSAQEHSRFRHPAIPKTYFCPPGTFYKVQLDFLQPSTDNYD